MGKPMYKVGSAQYKKDRVADGSIIRISADLRGSSMEVFKQLKETLGCGATGVIVHLIENYHPPMSSPSAVLKDELEELKNKNWQNILI